MPRDLRGCGRHPPVPRHAPLAFYSAIRLGDPEMLAAIMDVDPYFLTQDNGAGAPIHFATTYKQLDMLHHLLNCGAMVNQRDGKGMTALHRAAYLAHLDGYVELYEYLLSRGADPSIACHDIDPYLDPGPKLPIDMALDDGVTAGVLRELEQKYADVAKAPQPHADIGDWWALYDYGLDAIKAWPMDFQPDYPEERRRRRDREQRRAARQERRQQRDAFISTYRTEGMEAAVAGLAASQSQPPAPPPAPPARVVFLFPGQGSQSVGMLKEASQLPAVRSMLDSANDVLGYDLLEVCLNGPKEALERTEVAQPALFVAGLAAVELLRSRGGDGAAAIASCTATAGLSLGEYCALVFAGALSFEDGLRVVKVRSQSMAAEAGRGDPHGMLSVVGLSDAQLEAVCTRVLAELPPDTVCCVTNRLFPKGRVVSGHTNALKMVADQAMAAGALKAQTLAVAGAFHTRLMHPASEALTEVLASVEVRAPRLPVISNVTAVPFPADGGDGIRALLARQLLEPVLWEDTLAALLAEPSPADAASAIQLYELGPGQQIKSMVKRMSPDAWKTVVNVQP